jgi:hypothetical protein
VLGELNGEPVVLTSMPAGDEPFNRLSSAHLQRADAGQSLRVEGLHENAQ